MNQSKIILVDHGHFVHTSIYNKNGMLRTKNELLENADAFRKSGDLINSNKCIAQANKMLILPATYTSMTMLIANLKKIGVNDELGDRVIICCDSHSVKYHLSCYLSQFNTKDGLDLYESDEDEETQVMGKCEYCDEDIYSNEEFGWYGGNWRKKYEKKYKGNRGEIKKKANFVDWPQEYEWHNQLLEKIEHGTNFEIIYVPTLEADDLVAVGSRYYKDYECIILGQDHDYDQLLIQENTKIFSPHRLVKNNPYRILNLDRDKEIKAAYASLQSKIKKEAADNLVGDITNENEYNNREIAVKLIELPDFVTNPAIEAFKAIENVRKVDNDLSVFSSGIQKRFNDIYKTDKIVSYQFCRDKFLKAKNKKKRLLEIKKGKLKNKIKPIKVNMKVLDDKKVGD